MHPAPGFSRAERSSSINGGAAPPRRAGSPPASPVTRREREVITLIALGCETRDILRELCISSETVRGQVHNAMVGLGTYKRAQLVVAVLCSDP